ncbi:MAG: hypothetical protein IKI37_07980 [Oscillospiraceae bacterium]|nr:hypothetical protein [Oscillospiraceae bacterium]MBR7085099.1 hypothetical protein [Oscillospiraceae bacterium]
MILDNTRSAKDYISESYAEELKAIHAKARLLETPASITEREKIENTFALAEAVMKRDILSQEVTEEYTELLRLIKAKKEELKKLYGIDADTDGLQAVKNAQKSVSDQFAQELAQKETAFQDEMKQFHDEAQKNLDAKKTETETKLQELSQKTAELLKSYQQESKREKEEFDYNLKRARKQEKEERAKVIADREKALQLREQEANTRKQECLDKLNEIQDMKQKVENIPAELETAKAEGAASKEKEVNKDYGYHKWMADKENQTRINELQDEFNALQKKYQALCQEKDVLSEKLDKCNAESRQLTSDTVRSIGGINILNTDNHPYNGQGKK